MAQGRKFTDSVTTAILCDDGTCLCSTENSFISLPFTKVHANATWRNQSIQDAKEACGLDLNPTSIFKFYKIWIPGHTNPYVTHVTFLFYIDPETKKKSRPASGRFSGRLKWFSELELSKFYEQDWLCTSSILELFPKLMLDKVKFQPHEVYVTNILTEVSEDTLMEGLNTHLEITLANSGLKSVQPYIYKEFMFMAFPNYLLSFDGFKKILNDLGAPRDDIIHLFRTADFSNRKFLSFREFICLLAVMEPTTNHGGISGEVRCRYIFRFFDRDRDGVINYKELKEMVINMRKSKGLTVDTASVEKEHASYASTLNVTPEQPMALNDFLRYAGELKIRGLSQVLRLVKNVKTHIQAIWPADVAAKTGTSISNRIVSVESPPKILSLADNPYAKIGEFEVAMHTVRVVKSGSIINVEPLCNIRDIISATCLQQANITKEARRLSIDTNSQETMCNELIKSLRSLVLINKTKSGNRGNRKEQYQWGTINSGIFANRLCTVCTSIRNQCKKEARMLDLKSPIYILGDFHGNYGDLQYFEKMFWPLGPGFCPCSLLFLGDYVDRGYYGMEIITYLFCYKYLYPHKIYLVRGNHEIREIQKSFTFHLECLHKFGDKVGNNVWENINLVFDCMPLAAVVDGKLFCCHGGIPPPWLCPIATAINNIPSNLNEPDLQSSLAWELMWNDPIREQSVTQDLDVELKVNEGFAMNVRRGTAHVFNCDGLERFLNTNGFSHVIRAHEMMMSGCSVILKGKLITVFSSSKYNNQNNEAACVLVDMGKLRIMRLDTLS